MFNVFVFWAYYLASLSWILLLWNGHINIPYLTALLLELNELINAGNLEECLRVLFKLHLIDIINNYRCNDSK